MASVGVPGGQMELGLRPVGGSGPPRRALLMQTSKYLKL